MERPSAREQFGAFANGYATSAIHAQGDDLGLMVAYAETALGDLSGRRVLDVATGAGHTAVAFANAGAWVAAVDVTPEMLDVAREVAWEWVAQGSIAFHEGRAENLPFGEDAFDVVTCRIAAHHFEDPAAFVRESARVLAPHGRFVLVDNLAPEDPDLADQMNRIESVRDPSHVEAYGVSTWTQWLDDAGMATEWLQRWHRRKDWASWTERSGMQEDDALALEASILAFPDEQRRYFGVETEDGRIVSLTHETMLLAARAKP